MAMAIHNTKESDSSSSLLLALPVELLQRVTDNLSDETLTTFRLTCKTIEVATFDQFAKIFFEERHCFVYEKPRWTLLNDIVSSRMADRIRQLILTTDVLAPASHAQLQMAPSWFQTGDKSMSAQFHERQVLAKAALRTETSKWPSKDLIECCLKSASSRAPKLHVKLDFDDVCQYEPEEKCMAVTAMALGAIAASSMKITTFNTLAPGISGANEIAKTQSCDLSSCMRALQSFSYTELNAGDPDMDDRNEIIKLLESTTELRSLSLTLDDYLYDTDSPLHPTVTKLLSTSNYPQLETLVLNEMKVLEADLLGILARYRNTLRKVDMRCVCIVGSDNAWLSVVGVLASMPLLTGFSLCWLQLNDTNGGNFALNSVVDGEMVSGDSMACEGREPVVAGLKELLYATPWAME